MKTKILFFLVCVCALTWGIDAQAKVGDVVWQGTDAKIGYQGLSPYGKYDVYDGTFYTVNQKSKLAAYAKDDFSLLWEGDDYINSEYGYSCDMRVSKDAIYLVSSRSGIWGPALIQKRSKKNGVLLWEKNLMYEGGYVFLNDISATERGLYLSYNSLGPSWGIPLYGQNGTYRIDPENGEKIWGNEYSRGIAAYDGPNEDFVYVYNGFIRRLDQDTGKEIWKSAEEHFEYNEVNAPDVDHNTNFDNKGNVYIVDNYYKVAKLDVRDGSVLARSQIRLVDPSIRLFYYNGDMYVYTLYPGATETTMFSLNANDLSENWRIGYDPDKATGFNYGFVPYYVENRVSQYNEYYARFYDTITILSTGWSIFHSLTTQGFFVDDTGIYKFDIQNLSNDKYSIYGFAVYHHIPTKLCVRENDCMKSAQYVSQKYSIDKGASWQQGLPIRLEPEKDFSVSMTMKNTGNTSWYKSGLLGISRTPTLLRSEKSVYPESVQADWAYTNPGSFYPKDKTYTDNPAYFSTDYVRYIEEESGLDIWINSKSKSIGPWQSLITDIPFDNPVVDPGETVTFTQNFTAPTTPGCYEFESWQMSAKRSDSVKGIEWFGDKTPKGTIAVGVNPATCEIPTDCTHDYRCISAPTSEKCDNTNCGETITTNKPICIDLKKCTAKDGILSVDVCKSNGITCPEAKTEVCKCSKLPGYNYREVAP